MFLLVPAYPGCPGSKAVKRSLLLLLSVILINSSAGSPGRLSGKFATDLLAHFSVELSVVYVTEFSF